VFEDSGWAEAFQRQGPDGTNHVAVLGFETNNPIHDDHDGRGPHFHVGLKSQQKDKESNPAFYINTEDRSVSQSVYSTQGVELTSSGLFGVLRLRGELAIGPLIRLKNRRTGMYLYVRESEQGPNQGLFQSSDGDSNVVWLLAAVKDAKETYVLCNVRSNCFAHVAAMRVVDPLSQSSDFVASASQWLLAPTAEGFWTLTNVASKLSCTAFSDNRHYQIAQFAEPDAGSEWLLECRNGDNGWTPVTTRSALPPTYKLSLSQLAKFNAQLSIYKNGVAWSNISFTRSVFDDRIGLVDAEVRRLDSTAVFHYSVKFERLTGKEVID
jgi:hypothetical protein